jgi:hypothetical protein
MMSLRDDVTISDFVIHTEICSGVVVMCLIPSTNLVMNLDSHHFPVFKYNSSYLEIKFL